MADSFDHAFEKQRKAANDRIREAYKKGADISTIAKMRLQQDTMEKGQKNIQKERAQKEHEQAHWKQDND